MTIPARDVTIRSGFARRTKEDGEGSLHFPPPYHIISIDDVLQNLIERVTCLLASLCKVSATYTHPYVGCHLRTVAHHEGLRSDRCSVSTACQRLFFEGHVPASDTAHLSSEVDIAAQPLPDPYDAEGTLSMVEAGCSTMF